MLKIKSNTNEFTIIFSEKIGKKINVEKFSVLALSFFQLQRRIFLFFCFSLLCFVFCFSPLSFFSVSLFQCSFFLFCFSVSVPLFLVFSIRVALYFQPNTLFQPKNFFSPRTFSAQNVFSVQPFYFSSVSTPLLFFSVQPFFFS